ncbi:hypothetical protein F5879DRAFT_791762 [Lentinula edodes]|nr:hypothetical protein F5879DRAFT_791762 [Lentinula edodes]
MSTKTFNHSLYVSKNFNLLGYCTQQYSFRPLETSEAIMDCLPVSDLLTLSKSCKQTRTDVTKYKERVFSIEHAYRNFFNIEEIAQFQKLQSAIGLLVSGSIVLEFFNRERYNGDLDAFCNIRYCAIAGEWLTSHGYSFQPKQNQPLNFNDSFSQISNNNQTRLTTTDEDLENYNSNTVAGVWDFIRNSSKIQLIATCGAPLECIFSFHSTCVMNVFTHRAAYCFFSKFTLEDKVTMLIDLQAPLTEREMYPIRKYEDRGFTIMHRPTFRLICDPSSSLSVLTARYIGDKHCCRVPFHQYDNDTPDIDFLELNSWAMAYTPNYNTIHITVLDIPGAVVDCVFGPKNFAQIRTQLTAIESLIKTGALRYEQISTMEKSKF